MSKTAIRYPRQSEERFVSELHDMLKDCALEYSPSRLAELAGRAFQITFRGNRREDKMANALARGLSVREKMAAEEGGNLSADETGRYLGITKQSVLNMYHGGRLLGWRTDKQGAVRFPLWQFAEHARLPGLDRVLAKLDESKVVDDWGKIGFFLQSQGLLGNRRPLDLLRENDVEGAVKAAGNFV